MQYVYSHTQSQRSHCKVLSTGMYNPTKSSSIRCLDPEAVGVPGCNSESLSCQHHEEQFKDVSNDKSIYDQYTAYALLDVQCQRIDKLFFKLGHLHAW